MFRFRHILAIVALVAAYALPARADEEPEHENIVDVIETESEGNVVVEIDDELKGMLDYFIPSDAQKKPKTPAKRVNEGYRIQVFGDGKDQQTLRARVQARANAIISRFPKYKGQVYTFSQAPNWYCRVGNFATLEEANKALNELRAAFPQFSGEFRTVRCTIVPH